MKKKIYIIRGDETDLQGVKYDIKHLLSFFTSPLGGDWQPSEIEEISFTHTSSLFLKLEEIKLLELEYVILIYSGHGSVEDGILNIYSRCGRPYPIYKMLKLAEKQLSIFDCCRKTVIPQEPEPLTESILTKKANFETTRFMYEDLIHRAIPQQCVLFACSEEECATDTNNGAVYINQLLRHAKAYTDNYTYWKSVHEVHWGASLSVPKIIPTQHPDCLLPKCRAEHQLPFSINPNALEQGYNTPITSTYHT